MKQYSHKKLFKKLSFLELVNLICLGVILVVIPLIVRLNRRPPTGEELLVRTTEDIWESFSYYKSCWLIAIGIVILFFAISGVFVGEVKFDVKKLKDPVFAAAGVYSVFVILSTVFSQYKLTALGGIAERHESVFVLLVYMVILLAAKSFVKNEALARALLYLFIASAFLIGVIGTFQTFGLDIFRTDFGKRLVMGDYYGLPGLNFSVGFTSAYATLYNPNCLGLYAAFLTPVFFFTGLFADKKNPVKYICFFICPLMFICLYGSRSVAGYIGFFASIVVSVTVLGIYVAKFGNRKRLFFGSLGAALAAGLVLICVNFGFVQGFIIRAFNIDGSKYGQLIRDFKINKNTATIVTDAGSFILNVNESGGFEILNSDKDLIYPDSTKEEETYTQYIYKLDKIGGVELRTAGNTSYIKAAGVSFLFGSKEDGELTALTQNYLPVDINEEIPSVGFRNWQHLATGRGFIWSRSIPVLFDNLIIGGGPDSFAYQFPQHDLAGKVRGLGNPYIIVDKPHNTYLQIGVNTGMISLLAVLFIFGYYIVTGFMVIISKKIENKILFGLSLGFLSGVCAYLVCSLSTDSTVSVSPIFYAGLGFALAVIEIYKKTKTGKR